MIKIFAVLALALALFAFQPIGGVSIGTAWATGGHGGDSGGGEGDGGEGDGGEAGGRVGAPGGGEGGVNCAEIGMPRGQAGCSQRPSGNLKDLIEGLGILR